MGIYDNTPGGLYGTTSPLGTGGGGSGNVTTSSTLLANEIVVGNGGTDVISYSGILAFQDLTSASIAIKLPAAGVSSSLTFLDNSNALISELEYMASINTIGWKSSPGLKYDVFESFYVFADSGNCSIGGQTDIDGAVLNLNTPDNKALMLPFKSTANRDAIPSTQAGMMISNSDNERLQYYGQSAWRTVGLGDGDVIAFGTLTNNHLVMGKSGTAVESLNGWEFSGDGNDNFMNHRPESITGKALYRFRDALGNVKMTIGYDNGTNTTLIDCPNLVVTGTINGVDLKNTEPVTSFLNGEGGYSTPSGGGSIWVEDIDLISLIPPVVTPIITGANGIAIVWDNIPANRQAAIDFSGYTGSNDKVIVNYTIRMLSGVGGWCPIGGSYEMIPSEQNVQYFPLNPRSLTASSLSPLNESYRGDTNSESMGNLWELRITIFDDLSLITFSEKYVIYLQQIQTNIGGGNPPSIEYITQYKNGV